MRDESWNAAILSIACFNFGAVVGIIVGGAIAPPVASESWFKSYQNLIGALVGVIAAGAGLAVATINVLRQMRVHLMS